MVVCERPGFWRWMVQVSVGIVRGVPRELVGAVRAVPEMVRTIRTLRIREAINDPINEWLIGLMGIIFIPGILVSTPDLTLGTRIALILLSIFSSFVIMMHGTYRKWGDC